MPRRAAAPLIALGLLLAAAASAPAASVQSYGGLNVEGRPGEANAITVTNTGPELVVRDRVPFEDRGGDCRLADPYTVVCPSGDPEWGPRHPFVNLGDGDDTFAWEGPGLPPGPNEESLNVSGGPGDDVLGGSPAKDSLSGDEGADRMIGGDGDDLITGGQDGDHDAVEAGPGKDFVTTANDVDPGPGEDFVEDVHGNGTLRLRDGAQDLVRCTAPVAGLEADLRTGTGWGDDQDIVRDCFAKGTERGRLQLLSRKRRFVITRRTKVIRLRFGCPAATRLVCEATDMSDVYSKACECGYEARRFRILPGERLTVAFRPPRGDLQTLLHSLYWKGRLKGGIVWTSDLDDATSKKDGVWMHFVGARRRRR